ncbi:MAG: hypothetical protein ISS72_03300 [Candidatus Brocadiae bacterium]|nr:hypothetical protein [Candidatus Brocadiia bacterium]
MMMRRVGVAAAIAAVACMGLLGCGGGDPTVPDTPDGTVTAVAAALADGKPQVLWTAMPASYQKDVTGLVRDFAGKVDADIYDKGWGLAKKLVKVLSEKRSFILGSPALAQAGIDKAKAEAQYDAIVGALDALASSEVSSIAGLKSVDVGSFLRTTGAKLMAAASKASALTKKDEYNKEFVADMKGMKAEVESVDGDTAKVKITHAGASKPKTAEFVKVEGRWVPKEMADGWAEAMADAKKGLAKMSGEAMAKQKPQILAMMGAAEPMLDLLLKADSQEKFDQAIGQTMGMVMGAMMGGMERPTPPTRRPMPMPAPSKDAPAPKAPTK